MKTFAERIKTNRQKEAAFPKNRRSPASVGISTATLELLV